MGLWKEAVDSLHDIYSLRHFEDNEGISAFEDTLYVSVQYYQILWISKMQKRLFSIPTLTLDEAAKSPRGELLYDYQSYLQKMAEEIEKDFSDETEEWLDLCLDKQHEMDCKIQSCENSDETSAAVDEFIEIVKKNDLEAGLQIEADIKGLESPIKKKGKMEERKFHERVRKAWIEGFEELEPKKRELIVEFLGYNE